MAKLFCSPKGDTTNWEGLEFSGGGIPEKVHFLDRGGFDRADEMITSPLLGQEEKDTISGK